MNPHSERPNNDELSPESIFGIGERGAVEERIRHSLEDAHDGFYAAVKNELTNIQGYISFAIMLGYVESEAKKARILSLQNEVITFAKSEKMDKLLMITHGEGAHVEPITTQRKDVGLEEKEDILSDVMLLWGKYTEILKN